MTSTKLIISSEDFDAWFKTKDDSEPDAIVKQLHKVLRPFLLRRVKADVEHSLLPKKEINLYVGMTEMQRKWYRMLLEKDIDAVNGVLGCQRVSVRSSVIRSKREKGGQDSVIEYCDAVEKML